MQSYGCLSRLTTYFYCSIHQTLLESPVRLVFKNQALPNHCSESPQYTMRGGTPGKQPRVILYVPNVGTRTEYWSREALGTVHCHCQPYYQHSTWSGLQSRHTHQVLISTTAPSRQICISVEVIQSM